MCVNDSISSITERLTISEIWHAIDDQVCVCVFFFQKKINKKKKQCYIKVYNSCKKTICLNCQNFSCHFFFVCFDDALATLRNKGVHTQQIPTLNPQNIKTCLNSSDNPFFFFDVRFFNLATFLVNLFV